MDRSPNPIEWRRGLPVLTGPLVTLREIAQPDAPALFDVLSDPLVTEHISPPPPSVAAFEGFVAWAARERAIGRSFCYVVVPKGLVEAVGLFQVRALEPTFFAAEWGFAIGSEFWGTGVFDEAAALVARFCFDTVSVFRLEARAACANGRGNGALQKVGANAEAVLSRSFLRHDQYHEQFLWAVVRDDWRERRAARTRFVAVAAKARVQSVVQRTARRLIETKRAQAAAPRMYPFFLTDPPARSCPHCGARMKMRGKAACAACGKGS